MITEAQKRAVAKYKKKMFRRVAFLLHKEAEAELIEAYDQIPNKQEWFRECLRREVKHDNSSEEQSDS